MINKIAKYLVIVIIPILIFNCTNTVVEVGISNDNTWYWGHVGPHYVAPMTTESVHYYDNLNDLQSVWIASYSNYGYSIVTRYDDSADSLQSTLYSESDSIILTLYRLVLDGRIFYSSTRYGPSTLFSADSIYTPVHGKPIVLIDKDGNCVENADSIANIFKINPLETTFIFKIEDDTLDYSP